VTKKIALFGSGSGSNAENICRYFSKSSSVNVVLICTNNPTSFIVKRAKKLNIPVVFITKETLVDFSALKKTLLLAKIDLIVLAGFLLKIPPVMINSYPNKIINIHPSLLPKYSGKGMYGNHIHRQVLKNKESETGISIHFVNEEYDKGELVLQKKCLVSKKETLASLIVKIRRLEFDYFPPTIEKTLNSLH